MGSLITWRGKKIFLYNSDKNKDQKYNYSQKRNTR